MMEKLMKALREELELVRSDERRKASYILIFVTFLLLFMTNPGDFQGMQTLVPLTIGLSIGFVMGLNRDMDQSEEDYSDEDFDE